MMAMTTEKPLKSSHDRCKLHLEEPMFSSFCQASYISTFKAAAGRMGGVNMEFWLPRMKTPGSGIWFPWPTIHQFSTLLQMSKQQMQGSEQHDLTLFI